MSTSIGYYAVEDYAFEERILPGLARESRAASDLALSRAASRATSGAPSRASSPYRAPSAASSRAPSARSSRAPSVPSSRAPSAPSSRGDFEPQAKDLISKHDLIYFENGNIVLLSLPKDGIVTAFKVYKEFLILHSPVLKDMLSMLQLPDVKEFDNVPLIQLQDEASHLIPFLRAIYDPTAMPTMRDFYLSFNNVESVFMLSKKYQCHKLLKYMRGTLSAIWPKDLQSWDNMINNSKAHTGFLLGQKGLELPLPEPSSTIRLARDYDVPIILPAAFYYLLRTSPQALHGDKHKYTDHGGVRFGIEEIFAHLSHGDLACFIRGIYAIRKFTRDMFATASEHVGCGTSYICYQVLPLLVKAHMNHAAYLDGDALDLLQRQKFPGPQVSNMTLCDSCTKRYIALMMERRAKLWDSLPDFFGLPTYF